MAKKAKKQRKPIVKIVAFLLRVFRYVVGRCFFLGMALVRLGSGYAKNNKLISLGFLLFFGSFIAISYNAMYRQNFDKNSLANAVMTETINLASVEDRQLEQPILKPRHTHKRHKIIK
ncbi:hypothetical protein [Bartonella sp. TP]|uniref:hypothetical protein n=1 Tax=Bartonella sp. TP TaxID=3057550 RepID=UPI0025B03469|nr:hypothetical protein [Bartonella sp. TP]WJW80175.1 hypothetical protein QVL57_01005 [Bartonella sp. TP]